jgi:hypothetical protein
MSYSKCIISETFEAISNVAEMCRCPKKGKHDMWDMPSTESKPWLRFLDFRFLSTVRWFGDDN